MKKGIFFAFLGLCMVLSLASCQNGKKNGWEDIKTAGRYMNRGIDVMFGKPYDSRLIDKESDFAGPQKGEFIGLKDKDLHSQFAATDAALAQPAVFPGEKGSGLPGLQSFYAPPAELSAIFQMVHFDTDDSIVRSASDLEALRKVAEYMKGHPSVYLCLEGHCDERASAAYNMALGTRRANQVRVFLIKQGVDVNHLYPISYGKEKPLSTGHGEADWQQNRRVEFKIYQK
jgi:peptidoglycan-associated lipoprotein